MDIDGRHTPASATVDTTTAPTLHLNANRGEFTDMETTCTTALTASTVLTALVMQTQQAWGLVVCRWRIEHGRLHDTGTALVQAAVPPCERRLSAHLPARTPPRSCRTRPSSADVRPRRGGPPAGTSIP
ncbi:hypothetical protein [Streptomyces sp. NPDC058867]|uniref:hypothetical protein n=1 Tax=unclassified Streptomyces TaxID=2593676 RepID=UPI00367FCA9A